MTTELKTRDFLFHYLKKEYIKRSNLTNNIISHIERLNKEYLLTNIERTRNIKIVNELIKMLNVIYDTRIDTFKSKTLQNDKKYSHINESDDIFDLDLQKDNSIIDDNDIEETENDSEVSCNVISKKNNKLVVQLEKITNLEKNIYDLFGNTNNKLKFEKKIMNDDILFLDTLYEFSSTIYEKELKKYCPNDFEQFDIKIKELVCSIGYKQLVDIISIFSKKSNSSLDTNEYKSLLSILNMVFVPLSVQLCSTNSKDKKIKNGIKIIKQDVPSKYEPLLGNFYKIEININNIEHKQLHISGFFENDCVNSIIRTSQLCNEYISEKKHLLIDTIIKVNTNKKVKKSINSTINSVNSVPELFKKTFIQNMNIGELLSYDSTTFVKELILEYAFFQKYATSTNFKFVFTDYFNSDLLTKFKIIKALLMGSSTGFAGLLFGHTKDVKCGSVILADVIYKNLSLPLQIKLCKENVLIKSEIEKLSMLDVDDIDMKKQIMLNKNMPMKIKKIALEKINEMKAGGSEYYKQMLYVKTLIDFPWIGENDSDIFSLHKGDIEKWKEIMISTKNKLQEKVYGHIECKETIIELIAKWFTNPTSLGKSIGLLGPPGVGKTMIAMELGKAMGLPFTKINLAGIEDNSVLIGHSITYSGSCPGLIVKRMTECSSPRCIMFFDELDKTAYHHGRNEVFDTLIHVTDSTTNSQFNDKFFQDVSFPLNKVLFVFSFNNKDKIDPILLDRMEIIKVDPYSVEDKLNIVNKYLIRDLKEDIGLSDIDIKISDSNIIYLIETFTAEAGVRSIKRKLEKIFLKLNKDRIFGNGIFEIKVENTKKKITKNTISDINNDKKTIEITRELIDKYLGKPPVLEQKIHLAPEIGMINALYATDSGDGGILPVIMYKNQMKKGGKFELKITGNLQKVMIDSISLAFSIATNLVKPQYVAKFFESHPNGIHIHSGDLSGKKDGPSASITYTIAFISKILNMKIKNVIGLTGEIQGDCNVTAIGGLHYKLQGAKRAGIKFVFAPKENEKDLNRIKEIDKTLLDENFKVMLVQHVKDVAEYTLIENDMYIDDNKDITYEKTFNSSVYLTNSSIGFNNEKNSKNSDSNESDSLSSKIENNSDDSESQSYCSSEMTK